MSIAVHHACLVYVLCVSYHVWLGVHGEMVRVEVKKVVKSPVDGSLERRVIEMGHQLLPMLVHRYLVYGGG